MVVLRSQSRTFEHIAKIPKQHVKQVFIYSYPIPALAYTYYMVEDGNDHDSTLVQESYNKIKKNLKFVQIWDRTVASAAHATDDLLEECKGFNRMKDSEKVSKLNISQTGKQRKQSSPKSSVKQE
uniref:Uncharacterized protein n=1 Tax=Panagrolaimus sp. JU765 TaxID=591449 RepID=A0AC34RNY2_9BILA